MITTREENRLASPQAASSRCRSNRASSDSVCRGAVFWLVSVVYAVVGSYSFCHSSWCMGLPSEVSAILDKAERFTSLSLAPLKHATEDDTKPNFSGLRVVLRLRSPESTATCAVAL